MSLRRLNFIFSALLLVAVAGAVLALLGSAQVFQHAVSRGGVALGSVYSAQQLEIDLLAYTRLANLIALTQDKELAEPLLEIEGRLRGDLVEAQQWITSEEEARAFEQAERDLLVFLRDRGELSSAENDLGDLEETTRGVLDRALGSLDQYVNVQLASSFAQRRDIERWVDASQWVAVGVTLLVLASGGSAFVMLRRHLYGPLFTMEAALARFDPITGPPFPEVGVSELRGLSSAVNDLAVRLQRRRETQLHFVAGVAHDLRGPLTAMRGYTELLTSAREYDADRVRRVLGVLHRQAVKLTRLTDALLDATRIEAGEFSIVKQEGDLAALVRSAVEFHRGSDRQVDLVLPEAPLTVAIDPLRIEQVLDNLIGNALKYSPEGSPVEVRAYAEEDSAVLAVSDAGIGIAQEDLAGIFEPFRRTAASREVYPGAGLGLSVSKRIVEAHGGRIEVESRLGQGSTFRVYLPRGSNEMHAEAGRAS